MKKTATLCYKIFDLLYGWNALKGQKPWAKGFCPFRACCVIPSVQVEFFFAVKCSMLVNIYARLSFCVKLGQSLGFFMISPYLCTPKNKTKRKKALWNICLKKATMSSWLNFNTW